MSAATAGVTLPTITGVSPFTATRDQVCQSPWPCGGITKGGSAAYLGAVDADGNEGLLNVCGNCLTYLQPEQTAPVAAAAEPAPATEPAAEPERRTTLSARLIADEPRTCWYRPGECGGVIAGNEAAWVQRTLPAAMVCGPCADEIEGKAPSAASQPIESSRVVEVAEDTQVDGPVATPHQPDPTEPVQEMGDEGGAVEEAGDGLLEVHGCECKRISKKNTFSRLADGRIIHDRCGGLIREQHRALAEEQLGPVTAGEGDHGDTQQDETTDATTEDGAQTDDADAGDAGSGADGDRAGAGLEAGPAAGGARAGEGGDPSGHGAGEGDHRRDQDGGDQARAGGVDGGDPAQPAHGGAVEVQRAGVLDVQVEGVQGLRPGDVGALGAEDGQLAPRPDGLTPSAHPAQALGGLAAFFAQPADEDQAATFTLADFLTQPGDDERWGAPRSEDPLEDPAVAQQWASALDTSTGRLIEREAHGRGYDKGYRDALAAQPGGPVNAPDSDNYLGEFSIAELIGEIAARDEIATQVVALVLGNGRVVAVPQ